LSLKSDASFFDEARRHFNKYDFVAAENIFLKNNNLYE